MKTLIQSNKRTDPELERQVVVLIAQGGRYADISNQTGLAVPTIKKIKARNKQGIAKIQDQALDLQAKAVVRILQKSLNLLERRLDKVEAGELEIKTRELVAISKEMFRQSQVEDAPHDNANPLQSQQHLQDLVAALETGDEVALERIVFSRMDAD